MADGTRTHDNRNHNPGLYQLSYGHRRSAGASYTVGLVRATSAALLELRENIAELRFKLAAKLGTGTRHRRKVLQHLEGTTCIFRHAVLDFLVAERAISQELRTRMLAWRYSGFSAHNQVRVSGDDPEGRAKLAG